MYYSKYAIDLKTQSFLIIDGDTSTIKVVDSLDIVMIFRLLVIVRLFRVFLLIEFFIHCLSDALFCFFCMATNVLPNSRLRSY